MTRTTTAGLGRKVEQLAKVNIAVTINRHLVSYQRSRAYSVTSIDQSHTFSPELMTARECYFFLCGMLAATDVMIPISMPEYVIGGDK